MNTIYFYTVLIAIFAALIFKMIIDFRNISRLSKINKKNKKLDSICIAIQYENKIDDITNQIRSLNLRKNKLITIAVLVRSKNDTRTRKIILNEIQKITKNKTILIEFKNVRGVTAAIKNNCDSELVILINKSQQLSSDFIKRIIKISSRYLDQSVFAPYTYQKIGYSLGSLISVRSDFFSKLYHQIFGLKTSMKQIQPGLVYRVSELRNNNIIRIPVEGACSIQTDFQDTNILDTINSQISNLSNNKKHKLLFGIIFTSAAIALLSYSSNLFVIAAYFVTTFYLAVGIVSQFGSKKYSVYHNLCLLLILPINLIIVGIEYLFAILELLQKRICKNNKSN